MGSDVLACFSSLHDFLGQVEAAPSLKVLKVRLDVGTMLDSEADFSQEELTQSSTHWHFQDPAMLEEALLVEEQVVLGGQQEAGFICLALWSERLMRRGV